MGNEGQGPRDVASEKQRHPWEVFPDGETSAENGGKKREESKAAKEKNKEKLNKTKDWIKKHCILLAVALVVVVVVVSGAFILLNKDEKHPTNEGQNREGETIGYPDDYKIKDSITSRVAFDYANSVVRKIALEGISNPYADTSKIEDNMDAYIKSLETDYDKDYYTLYTALLLASYNNTKQSKRILDKFEKENHTLDTNQKYVYYLAYMEYYSALDDNDNYEIWRKKFIDDPDLRKEDEMSLSKIEEMEG